MAPCSVDHAMKPEKITATGCDAYLLSLGAYIFKPVQMGMGATTLDRLCCINGRFVAIEYKRAGIMEATPRQRQVIKAISRAGGIAFTTDSLDRTVRYLQDHALGLYNPET